jgi:hypothetical protein
MAYGKIRVDSIETSSRTLALTDFAIRTEIVDADINANAEIAVSKLADGAPRQLLQTDSAGTGVEWASNIDVPGTLDVTGVATFDSSVSIAGDLLVTGTTVNIDAQNLVVEDKNIIIGDTATPTNTTADAGGITLKGATDKTLTWLNSTSSWTSSEHLDLANGKSYRINNTEVLSSTSLGSGVTGSSLTSVGTINSGTWQGSAIADTYLGTISTAGKVSNSATTAASTNTAGTIVVRDASGNFSAGTITANLTGTASAIADNTVTSAKIVDGSIVNGDINASAAIDPSKISGTAVITSDSRLSDTRTPTDNTVSTAKIIDGAVTSAKIADGTIVNGDVSGSAGIAGTKISPDFGSQNILTTGSVGVNVGGSPSEKLHVGGNILATGNVTAYSDASLKENIESVTDALSKVLALQGVTYTRIDEPEKGRQLGLIAQEVERYVPEVVSTHDTGIKSLAYGSLVALLIEAIKEQQIAIKELQAAVEEAI